jgi:hypothetical protein
MPTMLPGVSAAQALQVLQRQDAVLAVFPEVARVFGKAGRAETANGPSATEHDRDNPDPETTRAMARAAPLVFGMVPGMAQEFAIPQARE